MKPLIAVVAVSTAAAMVGTYLLYRVAYRKLCTVAANGKR